MPRKHIPHRLIAVFLFPHTTFSILVLDTYLKHELWSKAGKKIHPDNYKLCEALSATGLRSVRYALELDHKDIIRSFIANDLSKQAVQIIHRNIVHNSCQNRIQVANYDAKYVLQTSQHINNNSLISD